MYGSETKSSLGPKIWDILQTELKDNYLLHYPKRKFVNKPQIIAHVVYGKPYVLNIGFL